LFKLGLRTINYSISIEEGEEIYKRVIRSEEKDYEEDS